jgi:HEAT repeat protein
MTSLAHRDPNLLFDAAQDDWDEEEGASLSPAEALRKYQHMVVLGDPGAGKTTMLKHLCLLSAQAKLSDLPDFPILITLNRYAKASQSNLLDFIVSEVTDWYGFPQLRSYLEKRLEEGSVLLLLDGLDEVAIGDSQESEAIYRRAADEINRLTSRYARCPVVVTSRRAGWKGLLAPAFRMVAVLDFDWDDIQRFVDNWFGEGADRARRLQNVLSQQTRMRALAANPLLLSLIALVFERDLELPERRAMLYDQCVRVLLIEWDAHRGIKRASRFTTDRKRDLLEEVALYFHCQGLRYFPKGELLEVIASYLPTINISAEEANLVLDEISAQHGLLREQAADWFGFLHLTLQEYFTAVSIDQSGQLDLALAHLYNAWWEEVILLLASMLKDATPLLDAILQGKDDIFFGSLLLAGRCLVGTPRIARVELREQILTQLERLVEDEGQHWLPRTHAVRILGESDAARRSEYFFALLGNQAIAWQVRAAAVDALASTKRRGIAQDLAALLPDEKIDRKVRDQIIQALVVLSDKSTIPSLMIMLPDPEIDSHVRRNSAWALSQLADDAIVPRLLELLLEPSLDFQISWRIGMSLVNLEFTADPEELFELLQNDQVPLVARWALAKSVDHLDSALAPEIARWLADESLEPSIRWSIGYRLGDLGEAAPLEELQEIYQNESTDLTLRACVAIALFSAGQRERAGELRQLLLNPDLYGYIRRKAAEALIRFEEEGYADALMHLLQTDIPPHSRRRMVRHLAGLGDPTIAHHFLNSLREEVVDRRIRAENAEALDAFDLQIIADEVRALVIDESVDSLVRGRAVQSLAQDEDRISWLLELMERKDITEEVFLALYGASRQAGVRVFRTKEGYEILPLEAARVH